ncbi:MAG: extracellular solute-binding protein [Chloroflexi bacterium]|nr:extracellular solute-binding protein [Chloroflexota bacterium]MCY3937292.1 extracellular solute-binding protein [Chloroflexota bacterium]
MRKSPITRRRLLAAGFVGTAAAAALAGCGETQIVEKEVVKVVTQEVPVERVVTQIVEKAKVVEKEVPVEVQKVVTQIVEKETIVEKEKIVEKVVTAAPMAPKAVTIEVSFPANNPANIDYIKNTVNARFMAANPHITVESETVPWGEWSPKLRTRLAADEAPDVFLNDEIIMPGYVARGAILALDEFAKRDAEQIANVPMLDRGMDNRTGKRYGLSRNAIGTAMTYNARMLEEAGIEPAPLNSPWTWDEYLENVRVLTFDTSGRHPGDAGFDLDNVEQWGAYLRDNWVTQIVPTVYQNDGEIIDAQARNSTFNLAETEAGLKWRNDLMYVHMVAPDPDETAAIESGGYHAPLINGRAAMYEHLLGQESHWPDPASLDFEIGSMVGLSGTRPSNSFFSHQMHVAKSSAHPEEAWMYMVFQVTDEQSALEIYTKADYGLPANTKLWTPSALGARSQYPTSIDPWLHELDQGWMNGLGTNVAWVEWYVAWRAEYQESSFNRRPISESVVKMQEESQKVLDRVFKDLQLE